MERPESHHQLQDSTPLHWGQSTTGWRPERVLLQVWKQKPGLTPHTHRTKIWHRTKNHRTWCLKTCCFNVCGDEVIWEARVGPSEGILLVPCLTPCSLLTEQTGLLMMQSTWDCTTSSNIWTNQGLMQGSFLWISTTLSTSSSRTPFRINWHSSLYPPPSVSGSPASWQTGSS